MLPMYFAELVKANPGSHVHLDAGADDKLNVVFFHLEHVSWDLGVVGLCEWWMVHFSWGVIGVCC